MLKAQIVYHDNDGSEMPLLETEHVPTIQALAQCILREFTIAMEAASDKDPVAAAIFASHVTNLAGIIEMCNKPNGKAGSRDD